MTKAIPLGGAESARLEFKSRDARPLDLAREVVAFLNAGGGEIWWGLREEGGRAATIEPFEDGEKRRRDLQEHLVDTVEPPPTIPGDVGLHLVPHGQGHVLRVVVRKLSADRAPAAQLRDQGRRFWIRGGARSRVMSHEEIASAFRDSGGREERVEQQLIRDRERVLRAGRPCFWMKVQPVPDLPFDDLDLDDRGLWDLLMKPPATGNRSSGWTFILELKTPQRKKEGLWHGYGEHDHVLIRRTGAIEFTVPLDRLQWKGDERELWPPALMEFPVSILRLAGKFLERHGQAVHEVRVDFAMVGLQGWSLRRGSPRHPAFRMLTPSLYQEGDELTPPRAFRFTKGELVSEPDRAGFRLIRFIYESFGYGDDAVPPEFDRLTGVLALPG